MPLLVRSGAVCLWSPLLWAHILDLFGGVYGDIAPISIPGENDREHRLDVICEPPSVLRGSPVADADDQRSIEAFCTCSRFQKNIKLFSFRFGNTKIFLGRDAKMTRLENKESKLFSTYCNACVCGPDVMQVEVVGGLATRVQPNFDLRGEAPADGKVCVKPYGQIQKLYDPNRILKPMKRTNPRKGREEDPGWTEITWDEALELVAGRLNDIRARGLLDEQGNPRVALTTGSASTAFRYMGTFLSFLDAWGPIDKSLGAGGTAKCNHSEHIYGELWHRAYMTTMDAPNCDYVLAFGKNINASGGVTGVRRHADALSRGTKKIQFEPQLSVTGAKATEWVPIRPNTDSAALYAMLHVLLYEHAVDELDLHFLKFLTSSPYLIGPNGFYVRDIETGKPLIWDTISGSPVPYDSDGTDPVLEGSFPVQRCIELGADQDRWEHHNVTAQTAFARMKAHLVRHSPEWAEPITDVPAKTLRRVANEFLSHARIGATTEVEGRMLPCRPVAVMVGRGVNNGWGSYECLWAQTMMVTLVGALEVPGGLLGGAIVINTPPFERIDTVKVGTDGFMDYAFNPTGKDDWIANPEVRHGYTTLQPMVGNSFYSQNLGATALTWMRFQGRAAETWPKPNLPDIWFINRANPLISFSETTLLMETIATMPFIVSFAYTLDETNHFADLLLPEAIELESTQLVRIGGTCGEEQFWASQGWALRQAVVVPRGEARDFTWISTELAKRTNLSEKYYEKINTGMRGCVPLKGKDYDFSLDPKRDHDVGEIWDAACRAASSVLSEGKEQHGLDWFKDHGFMTRPYSRLNWYLYPKMVDMGLRFELPYQERYWRIGVQLARRLHETGVYWWDRQLADYQALPEWTDVCKIWEDALERNYNVDIKDYPFWLLTSRSMQYASGANVGIPLINEMADNVNGQDGVMINTKVAKQRGINDGDMIDLRSPVGSTRARARLREGIRPDVLVLTGQFGQWKTPYAKDKGRASLNDLVPMHLDLIDGMGSSNDMVKADIGRLSS
jgi:phenylacetyl-CoA:acceptor oxidoreductase